MKRSGKNKAALIVAAMLGAGALFAAAGCSPKKGDEIRAEGETTIIASPTKTAAEYTPEENAYVLAGKLKSLTSYRTEVKGEVSASVVGPIGYKQTIADTHIKNGDESFLQAKSTSALVNVGKQAFFKGDKVAMRDASDVKNGDWSDSFSVTTLSDYRANLGAEPTALSNYILNDDTITSSKMSVADDVYTCRYEIDPVKGTSRYAVKMMNYGGLKSKPEYESCVLEVKFDKEWTPISLKAEDKYKISLVGNMSCTSTLTETFYDIGKTVEIPDAALFREKLGGDPTDIVPDDTEDKDGLTALADAILNTDLSGGMTIRGSVSADLGESRLTELPVDAWLSFDLAKFAFDGLSGAFRARVSTEVLGVPAEFIYTGDGRLYAAIGSTRYKYELPDLGEGMELQEVLGVFTAEKLGKDGNTYRYKLTLDAQILDEANAAIADFAARLSGPVKDLFGSLSLGEVSATVEVHKGPKDAGKISGVKLFADFGAASLGAEVSVSERAETLPSANELAVYEAADAAKLAENFGALFEIATKLTDFDWTAGMNLTLKVGLDSDANPGFMMFDLPVQIQILPEELLAGNVLGALRFCLTVDLEMASMGVPVLEIYYQNGMLYVVQTVTKETGSGEETYASKVTSVNVVDGVLGLVADALLPGGSHVAAENASDGFDLIAFLADAVLNADVETTSDAQTGSVSRIQIDMSDNVTSLLAAGYAAIWDAVEAIELGDLEALKPLLLAMFDFPIDRACLRANFAAGALNDISFRLINDGTAPLGSGKDLGFVLGVTMGEEMNAGEADKTFEKLAGYLAAYDEGASVREMIAKLKADGVQWLGDSYGAKLDEAEKAYKALSAAAKETIDDYAAIDELRGKWEELRGGVNAFLAVFASVKNPEMEAYLGIFLEQANGYFDNFDQRQTEYLGDYAKAEYLAVRLKYEKETSVPALKADIDKLTAEEYKTSAKLSKAVEEAQAKYDKLYADSKELVTNYGKIEEARKLAKSMAVSELNASVAEVLPALKAATENIAYDEAKALKEKADAAVKAYEALAEEERALVENYGEFETAKKAFSEILCGKFLASAAELGTADTIAIGDKTYENILEAEKWLGLLGRDEVNAVAKEKAAFEACKNKHRELEAGPVDKLILEIGTVSYTSECRNKIDAAREAFKGLREDYLTWCDNRNTLAIAEANYVKLAIDRVNLETITLKDKASVQTARMWYDKAMSGYEGTPVAGIVSYELNIKGENYGEKLAALEKAIADLETAA